MFNQSPKQKHNQLDQLTVLIFQSHGLPAHRVVASDKLKKFLGDVKAIVTGKEWTFTCKRQKDFANLYGWLEKRDALILKGDNRPVLICLPLESFLELIQHNEETKARIISDEEVNV